jgi:hypothetical protein
MFLGDVNSFDPVKESGIKRYHINRLDSFVRIYILIKFSQKQTKKSLLLKVYNG